ncbi:MAG: CPBP family intramembrane metalloprotease [Chloroflexi bacterium]|nr:CPBP family intramembrane metalloprotease [Chloroflexota bacterium]
MSAHSTQPPKAPRWTGAALLVAVVGAVCAALGGALVTLGPRLGLLESGAAGAVGLVIAVTLLALGVAAMLGGLCAYVLVPGLLGPRAARSDVGTHRLVIAATALIVLVANLPPLAYMGLNASPGLCTVPGFMISALSVDAALLGVLYVRLIRPGIITGRTLGLGVGQLVHNVGFGVLLGITILVVSALVQAALQAFGVQQTQLADLSCVRRFPLGGFVLVVLAGGLIAPISEELYFRGFVFRSYLERKGTIVAYVATSLLFATLHLNLPALLPILVMSLLFCWAYQRTGSIIPSIVGHALNNTIAFSILYFTSAPL